MKRSNITLAISTLTASLFLTACNNGGAVVAAIIMHNPLHHHPIFQKQRM